MRIIKDVEFLRLHLDALLRFVADADGLSEYRMPHVFPFLQNITDRRARPVAGVMVAFAVIVLRAVQSGVSGRNENLLGGRMCKVFLGK